MKESVLILSSSKATAECLKEYLKSSYNLSFSSLNKNFKAIIFDHPFLEFPAASLSLEDQLENLHKAFPQTSLILLKDAEQSLSSLSFPLQIFEKPFYLKNLKLSLEVGSTILLLKNFKLYPTSRRLVNIETHATETLTEKEIAIILYLHKCLGRSVPREELLKNVWNYGADITTHTLETHIYRLRQKLQLSTGESLLKTTEIGYELVE